MEAMNSQALALLLIFGMAHSAREPMDAAKTVPLHSRIACDGATAPEDNLSVKVTFSPGASAREFLVSRYQKESCDANMKAKCLHKVKEGWRDVWSAVNVEPSAKRTLPVRSCYGRGSSEPLKYVLSGWYKEGAPDSKLEWRQTAIKQVSAQPEVYEFADPNGATARLEISRW